LLHVTGATLDDRRFAELPRLLAHGDLIVFNDTRVVKARINALRSTGGKVELLLERALGPNEAVFQLRASHPPHPGGVLLLPADVRATVVARDGRFFRLRLEGIASLDDYLERCGNVPLPPYITRAADEADAERYQTVYARHPGAAAAPTAGLHFDDAMLAALASIGVESAYVTLHVGAGTFQPVESEDLTRHAMHAERYCIRGDRDGDRSGTHARGRSSPSERRACVRSNPRSTRTAASKRAKRRRGSSSPGYRFRVVDRLVTNFHLPKSTLLMLVSAFAGYANIRAAYASRSRSAISSATATRCCSTARLRRIARNYPAARTRAMQFTLMATSGGARRGRPSSRTEPSTRRCSCRSAPTAR
jgi:S-adenosylmethionine:tRNA ribosyltransferase-isomerase